MQESALHTHTCTATTSQTREDAWPPQVTEVEKKGEKSRTTGKTNQEAKQHNTLHTNKTQTTPPHLVEKDVKSKSEKHFLRDFERSAKQCSKPRCYSLARGWKNCVKRDWTIRGGGGGGAIAAAANSSSSWWPSSIAIAAKPITDEDVRLRFSFGLFLCTVHKRVVPSSEHDTSCT